MTDMMYYENQLLRGGAAFIGGIDEAGRGPLAGPVVVAGVIMPLDNLIEASTTAKNCRKRNAKFFSTKLQARR